MRSTLFLLLLLLVFASRPASARSISPGSGHHGFITTTWILATTPESQSRSGAPESRELSIGTTRFAGKFVQTAPDRHRVACLRVAAAHHHGNGQRKHGGPSAYAFT